MANHNEIEKELIGILNYAKEMLDMIYKGFKKHNLKYLEKVEEIEEKLYKDSNDLIESLLKEKSEEGIKQFIPIPGHLQRIGDGLGRLLNSVKKKIREDALFSDKAINEAYKLFDEIQELLTCLGDSITTKNRVLAEHINGKGKKLCDLADEYAIFHEERLIAGVCVPKSAPIYLDILDSFRNILWHIREITRDILAGSSEGSEGK